MARAIIASFYQSRRAKVPADRELELETNIALRDWWYIPTTDLVLCSDRARRLPKSGPVTNRDVLFVFQELKAERASKQRKIENQKMLAYPKDKPATADEVKEIFKDWKTKN